MKLPSRIVALAMVGILVTTMSGCCVLVPGIGVCLPGPGGGGGGGGGGGPGGGGPGGGGPGGGPGGHGGGPDWQYQNGGH